MLSISLPQTVGKHIHNYLGPENELSLNQRCATTALLVASVALFTFATFHIASASFSVALAAKYSLPLVIGFFSFILHEVRLLIDFDKFLDRKLNETYTEKQANSQDVILWITAKHDHNGAFQNHSFSRALFGDSLVKKFLAWRKGSLPKYQVVCKDVGSFKEIQNIIEKIKGQKKRIHSLWINAHGDSNCFTLQTLDLSAHPCTHFPVKAIDFEDEWNVIAKDWPERFQYCDKKEAEVFSKWFQKRLAKCFGQLNENTTIVLYSCNTGNLANGQGTNIAQTIASAAPGRHVIAPAYTPHGGVFIKHIETMDVRFEDGSRRNITARFCHQRKWNSVNK